LDDGGALRAPVARRDGGEAESRRFDYDPAAESSPPARPGDEAWMLNPLIRTLVKVAVASLIVGTILAHFGISAEQLIKETGLSVDRIEDMARRGLTWALPNLLLGAMVILPVWFVLYLFRPPGSTSQKQD
jgi:Family of unknown function (DUF6460)